MSERVCIVNADDPVSRLRYHRIGGVWKHLDASRFAGTTTWCGSNQVDWFGISSIRVERAEAMGATPCRRCFPPQGTP